VKRLVQCDMSEHMLVSQLLSSCCGCCCCSASSSASGWLFFSWSRDNHPLLLLVHKANIITHKSTQ
jgi:hypothetical protein